jgi:hypothetical protein
VEERPRVALAIREDVAREVLDVRADEHRLVGPHVALHEDEMLVLVDVGAIDERAELAAVARVERRLGDAVDERLVPAAIADQVRDRRDRQAVLARELLEVRQARHAAVLVHDLADDAGGREAGEAGHVDDALGLPGAHEHAAVPRAEREHVAGRHDVVRARRPANRGADRRGAVDRRDAVPDAVPRVDRDRERGAERRAVLADHHRQPELVAAVLGERQTDEPAPVGGHEVDVLGGDALGRDAEVALVLAILVVHEDHHADRRGRRRARPRRARWRCPGDAPASSADDSGVGGARPAMPGGDAGGGAHLRWTPRRPRC